MSPAGVQVSGWDQLQMLQAVQHVCGAVIEGSRGGESTKETTAQPAASEGDLERQELVRL